MSGRMPQTMPDIIASQNVCLMGVKSPVCLFFSGAGLFQDMIGLKALKDLS